MYLLPIDLIKSKSNTNIQLLRRKHVLIAFPRVIPTSQSVKTT